jgi:hypothetical protein
MINNGYKNSMRNDHIYGYYETLVLDNFPIFYEVRF